MLDSFARANARSRKTRLTIAAALAVIGVVVLAVPSWATSGPRISALVFIAAFSVALTAMDPETFERFSRVLGKIAPGVWWISVVVVTILVLTEYLLIIVALPQDGRSSTVLVASAWTIGLCALALTSVCSQATRPVVNAATARYQPFYVRSLVVLACMASLSLALTSLLVIDLLLVDLSAEIMVALGVAVCGWAVAWAGYELRRFDTVRRQLLDVVGEALAAAGTAQRRPDEESVGALVVALQRLENKMHDPGEFPLYVRHVDRELVYMLAYAWSRLDRCPDKTFAYEPWPWDSSAFASRFDEVDEPVAPHDFIEQIVMFLHELRARLNPRYVSTARRPADPPVTPQPRAA